MTGSMKNPVRPSEHSSAATPAVVSAATPIKASTPVPGPAPVEIVKTIEPPKFQQLRPARVSVGGYVAAAVIVGLSWLPFATVGQGMTVLVFSLISSIILLIVLYKAWASLPQAQRRTTPGKAVGFLFIPIFSIFWVWHVIPGFARDYNKYLRKNNLQVRSQPVGFYSLFCILNFYLPSCAVLAGAPLATRDIVAFNTIVLVPWMIGVMASAINRLPSPLQTQASAPSDRGHSTK